MLLAFSLSTARSSWPLPKSPLTTWCGPEPTVTWVLAKPKGESATVVPAAPFEFWSKL